jgi:diguanylate cyclase (GGDEF)-like protein
MTPQDFTIAADISGIERTSIMFMASVDGSGIEPADEGQARLASLLAASERSLTVGEHGPGRREAREAVALAKIHGSGLAQANALMLLATHEARLGEQESSLAALHRALTLFTEAGDLKRISAALNGMVMAYYNLGLQEEALEHASRSLEMAKQSGDAFTLAWAYNRAGLGHAAVGNFAEGIVSLEFALSLAREIGDAETIFAALNNLIEDLNSISRALLDEGATDEAEQRIARALELGPEGVQIARGSDSAYDAAIILLTYGQTLAIAGRHEEALAAIVEGEALAERGGYPPLLIEARYKKARLELSRGELEVSIDHYVGLLAETDPVRDALVLVEIHLDLWRAYKSLGRFREALEHHEQFHDLEREQQSQLAKTRARVLSTHLDLDRAQLEARRATLEAEIERSRTRELEAQALALREERELLTRRADQDGLTGLWNRRHVEAELPRLIREAAVRREPISVAFVDADHFKSINDHFGHLVGDDVLRQLADVLSANVRPTDVVARLGGEEFVVLLPGAAEDAAVVLGQRLCDAVRQNEWDLIVDGCSLTVSVGVASRPPRSLLTHDVDRDMAELLGRADEALYSAKRAGRDKVVLAT